MPRDVLTILAVVKQALAVGRENHERQRVVIEVAVLDLLFCPHRHRERMQLVEIHGAQSAGKQQLLGIKELIQFFRGLLPGKKAGDAPGRAGQQEKQERQADAQAKSFHASPRV